MTKLFLYLLFALMGAGGAVYYYMPPDPFINPPHPPACLKPAQMEIPGALASSFKTGQITHVAYYAVTARVLAKNPGAGKLATYAPLDLALGWEMMTDHAILSKTSVDNRSGELVLTCGTCPVAHDVMVMNSSNNHIIPATEEVWKTLDSFAAGQFVNLTGYIVNVAEKDERWLTSQLRTDEGQGSSEIFLVETARVIDTR